MFILFRGQREKPLTEEVTSPVPPGASSLVQRHTNKTAMGHRGYCQVWILHEGANVYCLQIIVEEKIKLYFEYQEFNKGYVHVPREYIF